MLQLLDGREIVFAQGKLAFILGTGSNLSAEKTWSQRGFFRMTKINKGHGDRCTCRLLAEAMGFDSGIVSYSFCQSVLQRHWVMHCNHGSLTIGEHKESGSRWQGLGEIDPIKAILIKNE